MIVLSWNCRGLGHPATIPALSELVRVRCPDVVFLFEHMSFGIRIEQLRLTLHFNSCFSVDCVGRSGGVAIFWNNSDIFSLSSYSTNHIDMNVNEPSGDWRLTGFYGISDRSRRNISRNILHTLSNVNNRHWIVIGDFNDLLTSDDKHGRVQHPQWLFRGFRETVEDYNLSDVPLSGYRFTWSRGRGTSNMVEEQLDRAMGNSAWHTCFPNATLYNLVAPVSDHNPILLETEPIVRRVRRWGFHFENRWLAEGDLNTVVSKYWKGFRELDVPTRFMATSDTLATWGNKRDSKYRLRKKELERQIEALQGDDSLAGAKYYKEARRELGQLHIQEETFWRQRAKVHWLREGDLNMRFFHATALARKRKKKLVKLKDDNDRWVEGQQGLCTLIGDYFSSMFQPSNNLGHDDQFLEAVNTCISDAQNKELMSEFTMDEFTTAIRQMHPNKSPGPDGYNPTLFQMCWGIVGDDIFQECASWLQSNSIPNGMNNTNVVLIPKCDNPQTVKDLRPISLCNVFYKILSKVLCNRLKRVLPGLVNQAQSAFIEGRSIQDNVLIAFEIMHSMKNKRQGRTRDMALKIDISKAYDRVDWRFLHKILIKLGFTIGWVNWMMLCVTTVRYYILVNEDVVGPIIPGWGLRQGDPLSPYLFILRVEGLSTAINKACAQNILHGYKICRAAPAISHLLFADDCLLFCKAREEECLALKQVLDDYEEVSGQAINYVKSSIFFSRNVGADLRHSISNTLGVFSPLNTDKYLGLPSLIGREKREIFSYVKERLWKKLQSWKGKKLSKAGKEILIKTAAQAVSSYCMSTFLLPSTLLDELHG